QAEQPRSIRTAGHDEVEDRWIGSRIGRDVDDVEVAPGHVVLRTNHVDEGVPVEAGATGYGRCRVGGLVEDDDETSVIAGRGQIAPGPHEVWRNHERVAYRNVDGRRGPYQIPRRRNERGYLAPVHGCPGRRAGAKAAVTNSHIDVVVLTVLDGSAQSVVIFGATAFAETGVGVGHRRGLHNHVGADADRDMAWC